MRPGHVYIALQKAAGMLLACPCMLPAVLRVWFEWRSAVNAA
jgi:hypothetical protein